MNQEHEQAAAAAEAPEPNPRVQSLQDLCLRTIRRYMNTSNCVELWAYLSQLEGAEYAKLQQQVQSFMANTFEYLANTSSSEQLIQCLGPEVYSQLSAAAAERQQAVQLLHRSGKVVEAQAMQHQENRAHPPAGGAGGCSYPLESLRGRVAWPAAVDPASREAWLSAEQFEQVFGMSYTTFQRLPGWRKAQLKKQHDLF